MERIKHPETNSCIYSNSNDETNGILNWDRQIIQKVIRETNYSKVRERNYSKSNFGSPLVENKNFTQK